MVKSRLSRARRENDIGPVCSQFRGNKNEFPNVPQSRSWKPKNQATTVANEAAAKIHSSEGVVKLISEANADACSLENSVAETAEHGHGCAPCTFCSPQRSVKCDDETDVSKHRRQEAINQKILFLNAWRELLWWPSDDKLGLSGRAGLLDLCSAGT